MTRLFFASLTLASLLGAVLSYQVGGYLPVVVGVSMFEALSLSTLSCAGAAFGRTR